MILGQKYEQDPWADLQLEDQNYLMAEYRLDQRFYTDNTQLSSHDNDFSLQSQLKGNRTTITGNDQFQTLSSVLGAGSGIRGLLDRNCYSDSYSVKYRFTDRTSAYIRGTHQTTDYAHGTPYQDENSLTGLTGFDYKFTDKTSAFGEVYYGQRALDSNGLPYKGPHQEFYGGFVGVQGDFSTKIHGSVKAGYETRQFSGNFQGDSSPVVEASLRYRVAPKSMASLTYTRSSGVNAQTTSASYVVDNATVRWDQKIGTNEKWTASATAGYQSTLYSKTSGVYGDRQDDMLQTGFQINYLIRLWWVTSLDYSFTKYSSTYPANSPGLLDYDANIISLKWRLATDPTEGLNEQTLLKNRVCSYSRIKKDLLLRRTLFTRDRSAW